MTVLPADFAMAADETKLRRYLQNRAVMFGRVGADSDEVSKVVVKGKRTADGRIEGGQSFDIFELQDAETGEKVSASRLSSGGIKRLIARTRGGAIAFNLHSDGSYVAEGEATAGTQLYRGAEDLVRGMYRGYQGALPVVWGGKSDEELAALDAEDDRERRMSRQSPDFDFTNPHTYLPVAIYVLLLMAAKEGVLWYFRRKR
ncbi:MAG: hypothetical protein ACR2QC_12375 [Gammaproteobacteria bacterium]